MKKRIKWKNLFEKRILDRGYDYYCSDAVENLAVTEDVIEADVIGTEDYEVSIYLEEGKIADMSCSCPYAEDGNNCKHMAAVLYEWTEGEQAEEKNEDRHLFISANTKSSYSKKEKAVKELVENADISVVKSYLTSILMEDEKLMMRFYNTATGSAKKGNIESYIRRINKIVASYLDRYNYIDYYNARGFIEELEEILQEDVRLMADSGRYMDTFKLLNYIYITVYNVDMDDSDGGTGEIGYQIYECWVELLAKVNSNEKKEMFNWFADYLENCEKGDMLYEIEQIIDEEFNEDEYFQLKLMLIEDMIKRSEEIDNDWTRKYEIGRWSKRYLHMLKISNRSKREIAEFYNKYWEYSDIRKYLIDMYMKEKDYDSALKVLDESIKLDKGYMGLIFEYRNIKKEIYSMQGNKEAYIKQLWELVTESRLRDLDLYKELKAQYSKEEWLEKREELFRKLPKDAPMDEIYNEEKLYDRLLKYVLGFHGFQGAYGLDGLYKLRKYVDVLKDYYPQQILQKYRDELNETADFARNRKAYREWVSVLREMKTIKGGPEAVDEIVKEWKVKYKRRTAMMEELSQL